MTTTKKPKKRSTVKLPDSLRKLTKAECLKIKIDFNIKVMRELGLDITDDDYLYDMDQMSIIQLKGRYIKYCEDYEPVLKHDEIDMNFIENSRLLEIISYPFFFNYCNELGVELVSLSQVLKPDSDKGCYILSYNQNGTIREIKSDYFSSESVRIFNLISKINKTTSFYRFKEFDVEFPKPNRR